MIRPEDVTAEELAAFAHRLFPGNAVEQFDVTQRANVLYSRTRRGRRRVYGLCWVAALRDELARRRAGSPGG